MAQKSSNKIRGSSGEHYVMYQLLKRGFIAALAPEGAENIDILVSDVSGKNISALQVKTIFKKKEPRRKKSLGWLVNSKVDRIKDDKIFYVFVTIYEEDKIRPDVFIIPSKKLPNIKKSYQLWLGKPGKNGIPRKDTTMRKLMYSYDDYPSLKNKFPNLWMEKYRDNWNLKS